VALVGPSGGGKTTLLRCLNGLIPHFYAGEYRGSVLIDGLEVAKAPMHEAAARVGLLFQEPEHQLFMFTVEGDVAFGPENLGLPPEEVRARTWEALRLLGIERLAPRPPFELSEGEKQRAALAGLLAMRPSVLALDEPTSMLSPRAAAALLAQVSGLCRALGLTALIVEHRLELLAGLATRLIVLAEGEVKADGRPQDVLAREGLEELGVRVPAIVKLQALMGSGAPAPRPALSPWGLASLIRARGHDRV